jgi:hypothetical protein
MRMAMGRAAVLGLIAAVLAVLFGASSQASGRATPPLTAAAYTYDGSSQPSAETPGAPNAGTATGRSILTLASSHPVRPRSAATSGFAAEDGTTLYRGMRGAADGTPELGSSAKTLGARPGIDIPVDEGGMVRPGTGGMSVNDSPTGMPEYRRPPSFGGSGKDLNMYCISSCDLGPGLRYVPDAGGHGFLEPAWEMPF